MAGVRPGRASALDYEKLIVLTSKVDLVVAALDAPSFRTTPAVRLRSLKATKPEPDDDEEDSPEPPRNSRAGPGSSCWFRVMWRQVALDQQLVLAFGP